MMSIRRINRGGHFILPSVQRPLSRVELHVHIDGSIRHETVYELAKQKGVTLPGRGTFEELVDYLVVKQPGDLASFLKRFDVVLAVLKGDVKSCERLAYEFVEDCSLTGILYAEARFCPHILVPDDVIAREKENDEETKKWLWDVTGALIKGLKRGKADFGTHVTLIATVIRGYSKLWYDETIELIADKAFHDGWIVGIDIAALPDTSCETLMMEAVETFESAKKFGIHRTVHAGESGGASQVTSAIDLLHAERIGHGYRIISDNDVFSRVKSEKIHLECCPWSSLLTGSIQLHQYPHPIIKFFEEGLNVSVNTDDPTITGTRLDDEFSLLSRWGLSESHFVKASFNAARSCFLPENEKADLIEKIGKVVGSVL